MPDLNNEELEVKIVMLATCGFVIFFWSVFLGLYGFELVDTSGTYLIPAIGCGNILARSTIFKFKKVENA